MQNSTMWSVSLIMGPWKRNTTFLFNVVGNTRSRQQYKIVQCCCGSATMCSLCTVLELQNISYCCQ